MDKKLLRKLIVKEFHEIITQNSFVKKSETLYIKITNENILLIINFDLGSNGFTCGVAMKPLYILEKTLGIDLSMGQRLSRFKTVLNEWWSYESAEEGIKEIKKLLIKNGLPWFEEVGTPVGIINFIMNKSYEKYNLLSFGKFHQLKFLAFSLIYVGNFSEGVLYIDKLILEISDKAVDWMLEYREELKQFKGMVMNDFEHIPLVMKALTKKHIDYIKINE